MKNRNAKTANTVLGMCQCGIPQEEIAKAVGMSVNTMKKYYSGELETGHTMANLAVGKRLFQKCMDGDTACLIFWAKTQMGWREKPGSAIQAKILERYKARELTLKETALEFEIAGLPIPETIRILLTKEEPEPVDPSGGQYRVISDEEMEAMVAARKERIQAQKDGLPQRREEIHALYEQVQDKFGV